MNISEQNKGLKSENGDYHQVKQLMHNLDPKIDQLQIKPKYMLFDKEKGVLTSLRAKEISRFGNNNQLNFD